MRRRAGLLLGELDRVAGALEADARAELADGGADAARVASVRRAHLRYEGTDTALPVPLGTTREMTAAFERAYRQQFSFLMPDKTILVEAVSVEAIAGSGEVSRGCRWLRGDGGWRGSQPFRCTWTEGGRTCRSPGGGTWRPARASTARR